RATSVARIRFPSSLAKKAVNKGVRAGHRTVADHLLNVGQRDEGVDDSWFCRWFFGRCGLWNGRRQFVAEHFVARWHRCAGGCEANPVVEPSVVHRPERLEGTTPSCESKFNSRNQIRR